MAAQSVEVVIPPTKHSQLATAILSSVSVAAEQEFESAVTTKEYRGGCDWLVLYGVGLDPRSEWRNAHIRSGGRVLLLDVGYMGERKLATGYARISIDADHPAPHWIEKTAPESTRFQRLCVRLRDDYRQDGPIVLVGMGPKSWAYYGAQWEVQKLAELRERFPEREIVYRPKPQREVLPLGIRMDRSDRIEDVLRGASLVVCRHSNVAVDAAIAGVPFECEDGAAMWLMRKAFTKENRVDFLRRLAWWQWTAAEAVQMLRFAKSLCA